MINWEEIKIDKVFQHNKNKFYYYVFKKHDKTMMLYGLIGKILKLQSPVHDYDWEDIKNNIIESSKNEMIKGFLYEI